MKNMTQEVKNFDELLSKISNLRTPIELRLRMQTVTGTCKRLVSDRHKILSKKKDNQLTPTAKIKLEAKLELLETLMPSLKR